MFLGLAPERSEGVKGRVAERLKAPDSKSGVRETVPWVQIPPLPMDLPAPITTYYRSSDYSATRASFCVVCGRPGQGLENDRYKRDTVTGAKQRGAHRENLSL